MKVKVNGNVVTIISKIPFDELSSTPLELKIKGETIYGVCKSETGSITPLGVIFNFKTSDGFAALNIALPPEIQYSSSDIIDLMAEELLALQNYEPEVCALIETITSAKDSLKEVVEVE